MTPSKIINSYYSASSFPILLIMVYSHKIMLFGSGNPMEHIKLELHRFYCFIRHNDIIPCPIWLHTYSLEKYSPQTAKITIQS